jgi:glutaminyl-peptide cyclotransferase
MKTLLISVFLLILSSVLWAQETPIPTPDPSVVTSTVAALVPEVITVYPHDPTAYTQGLELYEGFLYESTGLYGGLSTVRKVDVTTGDVLYSISLPDTLFAEGLTRIEDRFVQITWQNGFALTYDARSLSEGTIADVGVILYQTVGWGICYDGTVVYMTDGSSTMQVRDPQTFELLNTLEITMNGLPLLQVNELECVGDSIYGNVWTTDMIVRIDKASGVVNAQIDASALLTEEDRATLGEPQGQVNYLSFNSQSNSFSVRSEFRGSISSAVLNGIAYNAETDTFYITGKLWPKLFEVRFVPQ